jgi:hypothetical protein
MPRTSRGWRIYYGNPEADEIQGLELCRILGIATYAFVPFIVVVAVIFQVTKQQIEEDILIQKKLLSRITADTPISRFYGPGTWWAWLITLGMSHAHMGMALRTTGKLPSGWDYELIGASYYTVAAAVDLILKSRAIARLGDKAGESVLLPALVCAERVVSVGTGSSLFTLFISTRFCRSSGLREADIVLIPLIFALVASGFVRHAHRTIAQTAPVIWCRTHNSSTGREEEALFTTGAEFLAFLAFLGEGILDMPLIYRSRECWKLGASLTVVIMGLLFLIRMKGETWRCSVVLGTLPSLIMVGFKSVVILSSLPVLAIAFMTLYMGIFWAMCWVCLWWLVYIFAFFPQIGYFPVTGISVLEMDQIGALLAIVVVAAIRTLRVIFKTTRSSPNSSSAPEHTPSLPAWRSGISGSRSVGRRSSY